MSGGRPRKPTDRRQRRNHSPSLEIHTGSDLPVVQSEVPPYPTSLLKVTKLLWDTYWRSGVSDVAGEVDLPIVERLHRRYDERERACRAIRKKDVGRLTKGSQGQLILHPLLKYIDNCEAEIRQLEDRLGLSPNARLKMGATLAGAKRTLDEVNNSLTDADQEDPR